MNRFFSGWFLTRQEKQNGVDGVRDYIFYPSATPPHISRGDWHAFSNEPNILEVSCGDGIKWAKLSAGSNIGSFSAPVITQYDSLGEVLDLEKDISFKVQYGNYYEQYTGVTSLFSHFKDYYGLSGDYAFNAKDSHGFEYHITLSLNETDTSKQKATVRLITGGHLVDSSYISNDMETGGEYEDTKTNHYVVMDVIPTPDNASDNTAVRTIVYRGVYYLAKK